MQESQGNRSVPGLLHTICWGEKENTQNILIIYAYAYIISLILFHSAPVNGAGKESITERREQGGLSEEDIAPAARG